MSHEISNRLKRIAITFARKLAMGIYSHYETNKPMKIIHISKLGGGIFSDGSKIPIFYCIWVYIGKLQFHTHTWPDPWNIAIFWGQKILRNDGRGQPFIHMPKRKKWTIEVKDLEAGSRWKFAFNTDKHPYRSFRQAENDILHFLSYHKAVIYRILETPE